MRRFLTPRWLALHAVMIVLVTAFLALGWWQVTRAAAGNARSIAYAAEWPAFALFVIAVWVWEIRAELRSTRTPSASPAEPATPQPQRRRPVVVPVTPAPGAADAQDADDDPALAAYNEYLAWLAANPHRRPSEYRPASRPENRQGE